MMELEAPANCLQYLTATFGKFKSFNFHRFSIFAPNKDYAACFADMTDRRTCSITLRADSFGLPVNTATPINIPDVSVPTSRVPPLEGDVCQNGDVTIDRTGNTAAARCSHPTSSHLGFPFKLSGEDYSYERRNKVSPHDGKKYVCWDCMWRDRGEQQHSKTNCPHARGQGQ